MADTPDYPRIREGVQGEMARLEQARKRIDDAINGLKQVLADLNASTRQERIDSVSVSQTPQPDMHIIEAVRKAVRSKFPSSVSPPEIRDRLLRKGFNRSHLLTDIHGALRRLRERGEVRRHRVSGRRVYQWKNR